MLKKAFYIYMKFIEGLIIFIIIIISIIIIIIIIIILFSNTWISFKK